jgi:hypothetical protein
MNDPDVDQHDRDFGKRVFETLKQAGLADGFDTGFSDKALFIDLVDPATGRNYQITLERSPDED